MVIRPAMIFRFERLALDTDKFELVKDGQPVDVEPQVLSVLVHLLEHRERVVTRDELVESVWNGRFISDSAISSRIKSARRAIGDDGERQLLIRTIHGRGFRFVGEVTENTAAMPARAEERAAAIPPDPIAATLRTGPPMTRTSRFDRRQVIAAGAVGAAALAGGLAIFRNDGDDRSIPAQVSPLVFRAREAMSQGTREGQFQAIGIFRRVVGILPDYADGWGMLGMAYGIPSHYSERWQALDLHRRGVAAAQRATQLDPGNGLGELAFGILTPFVGSYFARREHMRRAVEALPDNDDALTYQAVVLQFDGYPAAAVPVYQRIKHGPMPPAIYDNYIRALWSAGRSEEVDQALADALALYPTHRSLWFTRYDMLLFSGRTTEALATLEDRSGWPGGIDYAKLPALVAQARALEGDPAQIEAVVGQQLADARIQSFAAETAIRMLSALGRTDDVFTLANAYYFGRSFVIPDYAPLGSAFSPEQRQTRWLFEPVTRPIRADPRFEKLVSELGFDAYWRQIGIAPDYRRS